MKFIVSFLLLVAIATAAETAIEMPDDVTLTSGRTLHHVTVMRWEKDRVVLKYSGGADPIAFSLIAEPLRSQLPTIRTAWEKDNKTKVEAKRVAAEINKNHKYDGQAFIVTRGAGNYKLGGMNVRIYFKPESELRDALKWSSTLPTPDAVSVTDAEGKFSFTAPSEGPVTIVAKGRRLAGREAERYLWISDASNQANRFTPLLTNSNLEPEPYSESQAYNSL